MVLSINRVRACFVHRAGVVALQDCNVDAALEASWEEAEIEIRINDGPFHPAEIELPPLHVGEVVTFESRVVYHTRTKRFAVGEKLSFSAAEATCMGLTIARFCEAVALNVARLALALDDPFTLTVERVAREPDVVVEEVGGNLLVIEEVSLPDRNGVDDGSSCAPS